MALLALALVGAAGAIFWMQPGDDAPIAAHPSRAEGGSGGDPGSTRSGDPREAVRVERLGRALKAAVGRGAALGGDVEVAVMVDGWREPLVETSEPTEGARFMRMWSMSKVATMVALLNELGWDERRGRPTSAEVDEALEGAIVRSENCRQRRVVLELQRVAGGAEAARAALAGIFRRSGATARIATESEPPESICLPYLETQVEIADPLAPALLLGASTWRIEDAVLFMHALSSGKFGTSVSERVLELMREPKGTSSEIPPGELTAPLDWGAGRAFAGLSPAYKAGWGGTLNGDFLAGQIALVRLPGGDPLTIAVAFHPHTQPLRDDPGITAAPAAIELIMRALRKAATD